MWTKRPIISYVNPRSFSKGREGEGTEDASTDPGNARGCPGGRFDEAVPQQVVAASAACAAPTVVVVTPPISTSWWMNIK